MKIYTEHVWNYLEKRHLYSSIYNTKCMRIHGINLVVLAVLAVLLISSGCVSNTPENQPGMKTTTSAPSEDFYKSGFQAQVDGKYESALDYYNKSILSRSKVYTSLDQ